MSDIVPNENDFSPSENARFAALEDRLKKLESAPVSTSAPLQDQELLKLLDHFGIRPIPNL